MRKFFAAFFVGLGGCLWASLTPAGSRAEELPQLGPQGLPPIARQILLSPALSADGRTLAFVYDGDIWVAPSQGGDARRLTITVDNDGSPRFSPDGKWLAFRSRRYGSDDVFIMPAEGGEARRLTFSDGSEDPCCWLPDSSGVIFTSAARENGRDLWVVRTDAGEPWPITGGGFGEHESQASISPDGKFVAYVRRGGDPMRRRGYQGSADGEIWLCEFDGVSTRNHRALTQNASHDAWPCFADNDTILYATFATTRTRSSRAARLTAVNRQGDEVKGWGGEVELDPREISVGGGRLAFATGNYGGWNLHVGEFGKRPPQKVNTPFIRIKSDQRTGEVAASRVTLASEFKVSPDGRKIAFVAGGDLFVMPTEEGGLPRNETDSVTREKDIAWAPDSRELVFTRAGGAGFSIGRRDAAKAQDRDAALPAHVSEGKFSRAQFLPDGSVIAVRNEREIVGLWGEGVKTLKIEGEFRGANLGSGDLFDVSPDGQWLLYEQPNELYDDTLWVCNLKSGERRPLTKLFGNCGHATFSRDGKRVSFICDQEGSYDVWVVDLQRKPVEFKEDKLDKAFKDPPRREEPPRKEEPRKDEPADPPKDEPKPDEPKQPELRTPARKAAETRIDFDGIDRRTRRITSLEGSEMWPCSTEDGKVFYFIASVQGQSNIWKLTLDPDKGPDLKQLTQSRSSKSQLRLSADEKSLWFLDGGTVTSLTLASSKVTAYPFSVELRRNRRDLRLAAFDEAAWVVEDYFYDASHHGRNWPELCARYRGALGSTSTGDEFGGVMNDLLGELNSSHQGFTASDERSDGFTESTGYLGVRFDAQALSRGQYVITEILKGGPLDVPDGPLPGIRLVGINGVALGAAQPSLEARRTLAQLLTNTTGKRVVLHLNDKFILDGSRTLAVKPVSRGDAFVLYYEAWQAWQRQLVHKLSQGRLGYVHIEGMDDPSLRHFKHHLGNDALGREGLVIDVRFNGGGYTAVDVLEILIKRPWLIRRNREARDVSENAYRSITLEKPSVLMINQDSFSNAEILAEGYRRLGIGKIVGVDTAGGVIGTGGFRLIDGSSMRLPGTGAYALDGENLENSGRKPDLFVENHPEELDKGIDRQTEAAVKTLLEQLDAKGK